MISFPSDRKPPLAESTNQILSGRMLRSGTTSAIPSAPVSMMKPQNPKRTQEEYQELIGVTRFERGKFYDEYCALRNERLLLLLRRKDRETITSVAEEKKKTNSCLGVVGSSIKKRGDGKKLASARKSIPPNFTMIPRPATTNSRYSLRSSDTAMSSSGKLSFSGIRRRPSSVYKASSSGIDMAV